MSLFARFAVDVDDALNNLVAAGSVPAGLERGNVAVEPPRDPAHGDISTNAAMVLAKPAGMNPRALAELLAVELAKIDGVTSVEIAGPGFINMRLDASVWLTELSEIAAAGADYGRSQLGMGKTVNIEYVSANPTGPMHMGHCRGAVVGDALANVLEFAGHKVIREYYVNDAGGQVDVLAQSVYMRYLIALGKLPCFPRPFDESFSEEEIAAFDAFVDELPRVVTNRRIDLYPGDYLAPIGTEIAKEFGDIYYRKFHESAAFFREKAVAAMMVMIRADLALLGIHHNVFASEADVQRAKKPEAAEAFLRERGLVYDGQMEAPKGEIDPDWEPVTLPLFRSTQFGDDQDRPIKKSDGSWTYFGADMAYHYQKAQSANRLIDIWGMDHGGTVKRIKAAVEALTEGKVGLEIKLVQMVKLLRRGEPVKMSKRSGSFVTLAEVVEEVTKDVVRFTMLTQKPEAPMEFDFAKVILAQKDNSVFYVQYAHARICSTLRKAKEEQRFEPSPENIALLGDEEITLIREAANFPRIVEAAAKAGEPHRIAYYLSDLAAAFHAYWNVGNDRPDKRFILAQSPQLSAARLFLADNLGQVFRNGLRLMGVEAATQM